MKLYSSNAYPESVYRKKTYSTYTTRAEAEADMKRRHKRKFTINHTDTKDGGFWVAWYNA